MKDVARGGGRAERKGSRKALGTVHRYALAKGADAHGGLRWKTQRQY
jgi:hypothetical protein